MKRQLILLVFITFSDKLNCAQSYEPVMSTNENNYGPPKQYMFGPSDYVQSDEPRTETEPSANAAENNKVVDNQSVIDSKFEAKPQDNFVPPQDPIQQYVNSYGGSYFPPGPMFGYPNSLMTPAWPHYGPPPSIPIAYAPIQTEYEGYFVPVPPQPALLSPPIDRGSISASPTGPLFNDLIFLLKEFLPKTVFHLFAKFSSLATGLLSIALFGGAITAGLCTFTSLCTLSFASLSIPSLRNSFLKKSDTNETTTVERVRRAVDLFNAAIDKYGRNRDTSARNLNSK